MSEAYTIDGDTLVKCDNPTWQGQTFRPIETHILEYIDLEMRGPLIIPEPVIQVFMANPSHEPFGPSLSRNRYTTEKKCSLITTGRVRFNMQPTILTAGDYYVIIVSNFPLLLGNSAYWQYDKDDATYPRGIRISSPDSGATWTKHYNDDFMFAEFGDPPLPQPEPPPPIPNFAILDIGYAHWAVGLTIGLPTSIPCHLTCYYTDTQPLKHHTSRTVRGLTVPWGTYFCFVAWKTLEQTEPGDTLYHTFDFPDWPACLKLTQTYTFYDIKDFAAFWEPWGSTLTEYNAWSYIADPDPPALSFANGIITFDFTGTPHSGIINGFPPGSIPIIDNYQQPLHLLTSNPYSNAPGPGDGIVNAIDFRKGDTYLTVYFMIERPITGFGSGDQGYDYDGIVYKGWWWLGTGEHDIDLAPYLSSILEHYNLPPNLDGWYCDGTHIAHSDPFPWLNSQLQNDYFALYYKQRAQSGGRWFTFRGEVDDIQSPSVGPIFQHCHPGSTLQPNILRPNAPGDVCLLPSQTGYPCPSHYLNVDDEIPDEHTTEVISHPTDHSYDFYDLYHIQHHGITIPTAITNLRVYTRSILQEDCPALNAPMGKIILKTLGTEDWSPTKTAWKLWTDQFHDWPTNPVTGNPWTLQDIADLQIGVCLRTASVNPPHNWFTYCTQVWAVISF